MKIYTILFLLILVTYYVKAEEIEICNKINITIESCYNNLSINSDKDTYQTNEKIIIKNNLLNSNKEYIIEYWIENNNNNTIKAKINTTNVIDKQFTPKLNFSQYLKLKNKLVYYNCSNFTAIESEKLIYVYSDKRQEPDLIIKNITSNNLTINFKLNIYTGNISNEALYIDIINISNSSLLLSPDIPYTSYNFTIKIPYNCNIQTNIYTLYSKFNYLEFYNNFSLFNNCTQSNITNYEIKNNTIEPIINESVFQYNNLISDNSDINKDLKEESDSTYNLMKNINTNAVYESSNRKANKLSVYLLVSIIGIFIIVTVLPDNIKEKWYLQQERL